GRNWEGFGADPFLAGVATAATITGYQGEGVIACVKHYIANEQEHFRGGSQAKQVSSANVDNKTIFTSESGPSSRPCTRASGA
ncbi:family 3 glycoside hydrolase, partial [Mycena vulgaris]